MLQADSLGTEGVLATRNALEATPGMANHMLSCGRTLWGWGILRDYAKQNPFNMYRSFQSRTAVTSLGLGSSSMRLGIRRLQIL